MINIFQIILDKIGAKNILPDEFYTKDKLTFSAISDPLSFKIKIAYKPIISNSIYYK